MVGNIEKYSNMLPIELRMFVGDSPKDDLDWGLIIYLFENTRSGNIITLGKISNFFNVDRELVYDRLNRMNFWVKQYLNSEYGKIYYTYEITDMANEFIVNLIELLEKMLDKKS